ncbi:hypothetical protein EVAR_81595_1 [Eumeta japonica]|uniref:Uncharacterized protein n=1 Tax=Eumeta variegata TaxID=151549 RepID=A0A4C1WFY6_EUMVA|nr:hypothetical protein EVAR_81595_1 [Eumeta japonica]
MIFYNIFEGKRSSEWLQSKGSWPPMDTLNPRGVTNALPIKRSARGILFLPKRVVIRYLAFTRRQKMAMEEEWDDERGVDPRVPLSLDEKQQQKLPLYNPYRNIERKSCCAGEPSWRGERARPADTRDPNQAGVGRVKTNL